MESGLLSCLPPLPVPVWEVLEPLLAPPLDLPSVAGEVAILWEEGGLLSWSELVFSGVWSHTGMGCPSVGALR